MTDRHRDRVAQVDPTNLTPEQQAVFDTIAGTRGRVAGPFTVLLHLPAMADRIQHLGAYLRYEAGLDRDVAETAVLVTAQAWASPFEWEAHEPHARRAGVPEEVIETLRSGGATKGLPDRYRAVIDYARDLAARGRVSDDVYAAAAGIVGAGGMVEITVVVGYYTLLAMTLNAHEISGPTPPAGP